MKKFLGIAASVLAIGMAATVAGCAGCSGCSASAKNTALTSSNWYTGTSYKGIQPSFVVNADSDGTYTKEIINYDVSFDGSGASNSYYSVNYTDGSYSTEFYADYYDWTGVPGSYAAEEKELVYYFKTQYKISVQFTLKSTGETSEIFEDSVVTESVFRAAGLNLQPVYSKQTIVSHTPANLQAGSIEGTYVAFDAVYENFYNYGCTEVTSYITLNGDGSEKVTKNLNKTSNSLFDEAYLYIAVRSLKLSSSLSQSISLFSAPRGGINKFSVSGTDTALGAEEAIAITSEMKNHGLYSGDSDVATVAVNVNYTGGTLVGTTKTLWFAAIEDADNNKGRATLLKITEPLSYGLGAINFTLKEIVSTLWNG